MHCDVKRIKGKYRVVDDSTGRVVRSVHGKPLDGGGHTFQPKAERQRAHINDHGKDKKNAG